jgi:hypothetical protein
MTLVAVVILFFEVGVQLVDVIELFMILLVFPGGGLNDGSTAGTSAAVITLLRR